MISTIVDGKVLDHRYKKIGDFIYNFYVGDIFIGQVFNMGKYWSCVSFDYDESYDDTRNRMRKVDGFKNRYYASEYMLLLRGFIK